jgi:phosphoribosylglycinamide formyltransferase-1
MSEQHNADRDRHGSRDGAPPQQLLRLGVLISGSGSNLQALIDATEQGKLPGVEIALVLSHSADAYGMVRALKHGLPVTYLPWRRSPTGAAPREMTPSERQLIGLLHWFRIDLVVLAGWLRILSAPFLERFARRVINIHPALLPREGTGPTCTLSSGETIPALRGLHVVKMALDAGLTVTGSSVHYVTAVVDAGPVICQQEVPIEPDDTVELLHKRLKAVEHRLIVEAIRQVQKSQS